MRLKDKYKNLEIANQRLEESWLNSKGLLSEKYESEYKERMNVLSKVMQDKEKLDQELSSWNSDPKLMYQNLEQAQKAETEAFKRAQAMGEVRVYSSVKLENIKSYGTKSRDVEQSVSTDKAKSLFHDNNVNAVLSGKANLMAYYPKDVSTNQLGSERKLPITPLNPTQSEWDEGLVKNTDVKWDVLFYNPKKHDKEKVETLGKKHGLKAISIWDENVPNVIKNSRNFL